MANKEAYIPGQKKGIVEGYKDFNKITRNGALGIAFGAAIIGGPAAFLITPALLWAAGDQAQIMFIERFQKWREKNANKPSKSGVIFQKQPYLQAA